MASGLNIPQPLAYKLAYSRQLIEILDAKIARYLDEIPDEVIREGYNNPSNFSVILEGKQVPVLIPLICGDALQNIRSVLDYLVWELVLANNGEPDEHNAFPVCKSSDSFTKAKKRRLRGVHSDAVTLVESLQPYHFGQNEIQSVVFVLDKLANIQKHRTILMAQERHAPVEMINVVDPNGNVVGFDPLLAMDAKAVAEYIRSSLQMKVNPQMAIFVQFGEYPTKGMEVISTIAGLYENVALNIIPQFDRFFV